MVSLRIALVITTYNSCATLRCILKCVSNQRLKPDEVVIADDGSTDGTDVLVKEFARQYSGTVRHIWQENQKYRRSKILNKAIVACTSDYIITVDNDVLLHKDFVYDHAEAARRGLFVCGRRAYIRMAAADNIRETGIIKIPGFFSHNLNRRWRSLRIRLLSPLCYWRHAHSLRQMMGSNMAFWKDDFIAVNGFEEEFEGWGSEDCEFALRLMNAGLKRRTIEYAAIQWHMDHPLRSIGHECDVNKRRFAEAKIIHKLQANVGVRQYL